VVLNSWGIMIL